MRLTKRIQPWLWLAALGACGNNPSNDTSSGGGAGSYAGGTAGGTSAQAGTNAQAGGGAAGRGGNTAGGTAQQAGDAPGGSGGLAGGGSVAQAGTAFGGGSGGNARGGTGPLTQVAYTTDDDTIFANPERGFYHHLETTSTSYDALDSGSLTTFRTQESVTLGLRLFYLEGFKTSDISNDYMTKMGQDFAAARSAGIKLALRFAYTDSEAGDDASKAQILSHIAQLQPALMANADVIAVVQVGLIGAWGEWYYTQHFGDSGTVSDQQYADRKAIVDALLAALPPSRSVQLRTPAYKRKLYGDAALGPATAFTAVAAARIGHHNDAFVADDTDMGTYLDPQVELPYLEVDSRYVPVGGENDQYQAPRTACPSALADMARFHWSFINTDYLGDTINQWKAQGCYETMQRKLGYRLQLVSGSFSQSIGVGGAIGVSLKLRNTGFAAPFNPRALELVLRAKAGGALYRLALSADPRTWLPGADVDVTEQVQAKDAPAGTYDLLIALPDPLPGLHDHAEYAIRLANVGTWDEASGANLLNATLDIK
jgi:hypothetical protein